MPLVFSRSVRAPATDLSRASEVLASASRSRGSWEIFFSKRGSLFVFLKALGSFLGEIFVESFFCHFLKFMFWSL